MAIVQHFDFFDECSEPVLEMISGIVDAPLLKPRFRTSLQPLDWVVSAGISSEVINSMRELRAIFAIFSVRNRAHLAYKVG